MNTLKEGKKIDIICKKCDKSFIVYRSSTAFRNGTKKFCSSVCKKEAMKGGVPWNKGLKMLDTSPLKGVKTDLEPWNKGKTGYTIHSEEFKQYLREKRGENALHWRGGVGIRRGRRTIYQNGRQIMEHRLLVATLLNRVLKVTEVVHHIDGDKGNNQLENLFLFRDQSAHKRWHHYLKRHNLDGKILESNLTPLPCLS